jgi:hypothetical protein
LGRPPEESPLDAFGENSKPWSPLKTREDVRSKA